MHSPYRYFNVNAMPLIALFLIGQGPWAITLAFILCFVIHSLVDQFLSNTGLEFNIYKPKDPEYFKHSHYNFPLFFSVFVQLVVSISAIIYPYENLGEAITGGIVAGMAGGIMGMSAGHELIHRRNKKEHFLGMILLHAINYAYFAVEHMWHHIHVATEEDADSAKEGESLYAFIAKVIPHGYYICWKWNSRRAQMLKLTLTQLSIYALAFYFAGIYGVVVYTVLGLMAVTFLKWADYVEHYGLRRRKLGDKYENVSTRHSWDCKNTFTNIALFNLAEHSPHHTDCKLFYYQLSADEHSPNTLPYGHTTLMLKAMVPSYWYKFMSPYLVKVKRASIQSL